jgi:alginate O-acetyltransferase complex protein AlgI
MGLTFSLTVFAWIFFRAANVTHALSYISEIFSSSLLSTPYFPGIGYTPPIIVLIFLFLIVEWIGREQQYAIAHIGLKWNITLRWALYVVIVLAIFNFSGKEQQFIYFQF